MKPEIKAAWLAALRSGEYRQTTGTLRDSAGAFCCLGVLCDLAAKQGIGQWDNPLGDTATFIVDDMRTIEYLPVPVQEWAGVERPNPCAANAPLASWNDGGNGVARPHSFAEIADLIEAEL